MTRYLPCLLILAAMLCLQGCMMPWPPLIGSSAGVSTAIGPFPAPPPGGPVLAAVQKQLITSLSGYRLEDVKIPGAVKVNSVFTPGDVVEILYQITEEFPSVQYKLKPDDKLNVSHVFDPQFDVNIRVDSAGDIYLPLVEKVKVGGLTLDQAINRVRDKFREYVTKPHIMIRLEEFNHATESRKRTIKTMNVNGPFKDFIVPTDGNISVPFIPKIRVAGKTLDQVKEELELDYKKMGINTEVTCILKKLSARRVFVMGDVQKAGVYTYETSVNLAQAISMAEGFKKIDIRQTFDLADASGILIFRTKGVPRPTAYRVNLVPTLLAGCPEGSFPLQMDDVVYVPKMTRPRIFVFGEVVMPGAYDVNDVAGITQVIALAGGLKDTACRKSLLVMRKQADKGPPAVLVDLNNILKSGGSNDFTVAAGDVVYVPKKWISNANVFIDQWFTKGLYALLPSDSPLDFYMDIWESVYRKNKLQAEIWNLYNGGNSSIQ
jgi:protein involved in polysaccharide export with SLBB domain